MATSSVRPYPQSFRFLPFFTTYRKSERGALPAPSSIHVAHGPDSKYLCKNCGEVELYDLSSECLKEWGYHSEYDVSELTVIVMYSKRKRRGKKGCPFCLESTRGVHAQQWVPVHLSRPEFGESLYEKLAASGRLETVSDLHDAQRGQETFVMICAHGTGGLLKPQPVPPLYNPSRAQLWLDNCKTFHGPACNQRSSTVKGMKLIDCNHSAVVDAQPSWAWLALSYVWGKNDSGGDGTRGDDTRNNESDMGGPHHISQLPKTVKDAITITKELGYRYLWADQCCIDQKNGAHKEEQIRNMDKIYQGADMTLVAASGGSKHAGIIGVSAERKSRHEIWELGDRVVYTSTLTDPVDTVRYFSAWWKRAWT